MNKNLSVFIADDEENIRNGLKYILEWEELGFTICGEASSGKDAVEKISYLQPDIVILDIKMPGMTGLEVIKTINEDSKIAKIPYFIILSGFSDFDYAKSALNFGAKAYLLKPVDEDELQKVIFNIKNEIERNDKLVLSSKNSEEQNLKYYFMNLLQTKRVEAFDNLKNTKFFSDYENSEYGALIFSAKYFPEINKTSIQNIVSENFSFFTKVVLEIADNTVVLVKTSNQEAVINSIKRIYNHYPERTFITCGSFQKGILGVLESYQEATSYLEYLYYFSNIYYIDKSVFQKDYEPYSKVDLNKYIDDLLFCIETYSKDKFEIVANEMYKKMKNHTRSQAENKQDLIYCLMELKNKIVAKYPERDISDGQTSDIIPVILEKITFDDCFIYVKNVINSMIENFNFNTADAIIVKVIAYVKSNYTKDLKLEVLGDMFNCNSAYLGKKFKKYTGVQFNSYLDNLRIEDAKEKIKNSELKIYQISKLVGFANTDYFFMKFKKYTGYTPKEYKIMTEMEKNRNVRFE